MRRRDGAGRVLDYSYDAGGRLERVVADGERVARIERDFAARTMSAHGPAAQRRHRRRDLAGDGHRDTSIVTVGSRTRTNPQQIRQPPIHFAGPLAEQVAAGYN